MYAYEPILRDLERRVRAAYARQVLDERRDDHGAFLSERDGCANADHTANAKDLAAACYCFLAEGSTLQGDDEPVTGLNRAAYARIRAQKELVVIPGATHLFEEPGALEEVARLAANWFLRFLPFPIGQGRSLRTE